MAEGDAAIHAAGALLAEHAVVGMGVELQPIVDALARGACEGEFAGVFQKAGWLAHCLPQSNRSLKSSTVRPASRMMRRRVPFFTGLCIGIESKPSWPGRIMM